MLVSETGMFDPGVSATMAVLPSAPTVTPAPSANTGIPNVTPGMFGNAGSESSTVHPVPRAFGPLTGSPFSGTWRSYSTWTVPFGSISWT